MNQSASQQLHDKSLWLLDQRLLEIPTHFPIDTPSFIHWGEISSAVFVMIKSKILNCEDSPDQAEKCAWLLICAK